VQRINGKCARRAISGSHDKAIENRLEFKKYAMNILLAHRSSASTPEIRFKIKFRLERTG
jgi:hypothetical protein